MYVLEHQKADVQIQPAFATASTGVIRGTANCFAAMLLGFGSDKIEVLDNGSISGMAIVASDEEITRMNGESVGCYKLVKQFADTKSEDEHVCAVQAQCRVTLEVFMGLLELCAKKNGVAGEALLRTLFESTTNAIILAKHKEKLGDFRRNGQFSHLRGIRFTSFDSGVMKRTTEDAIKKTEEDFQQLFLEFKSSDWHKLGTKDAFVEAEYDQNMYDKYFRRASLYAHAEPFIVVRRGDDTWKDWKVEARPNQWKAQTVGVYVMSCSLMLHLLAVLSREFKLGFDEALVDLSAEVEKYKQQHVNAIVSAFADYEAKAKEASEQH